jgi:glycosyltransferase involved in cell wall biosynthesis
MVWFMSEPEHKLAHSLGPVAPRHVVTGEGFQIPERYDPEGFRSRHRLRRPFLLFAGRREREKGWDWLVETFGEALQLADLDIDLVTIGVGDARIGSTLGDHIIDLGFLSEDERNNAYAAALAYVQPSRMESFSRTIMEAWLASTPVLAIRNSEVVAWHCERSGGGLLFDDAVDLAQHLGRLCADAAQARTLADRGRQYVLDNYTWPAVLDRMEAELETLIRTRCNGSPAVTPGHPQGDVRDHAR